MKTRSRRFHCWCAESSAVQVVRKAVEEEGSHLSLPKMLSGANTFEISDFQKMKLKQASQEIGTMLLWAENGWLEFSEAHRGWLASKGIQHADIETSGSHTWMVLRRNLVEFTPLLFR